MKRQHRSLRYTAIVMASLLIGVVITLAVTASAEADEQLQHVDDYIATHTTSSNTLNALNALDALEPETVALSYEEWQEQQAIEEMDVWTLGSYLYGISEADTTRALKIISYEGYGAESPLSYFVACCCFTRLTDENYLWGFCDLYECFGGADAVSYGGQYGAWMDCIEIQDYAYDALRQCYMDPCYVTSCNGMEVPEYYVYAEWTDCGWIYVW